MLPNGTPRASREEIIDALIASGLWKNRKVSRLSVVGVRGYYLNSMGRLNRNDRGIYDDAFFVLSPDTFTSFNGNTDPSITRPGRAVLEAPQRVTYVPGWHGYRSRHGHKAFRQASVVTVKRDGGRGNGTPLGKRRFQDAKNRRFWINLHRGGRGTTSSAGCQTVPPNQWDAFRALVMVQLERFQQQAFSYYLLDGPIR